MNYLFVYYLSLFVCLIINHIHIGKGGGEFGGGGILLIPLKRSLCVSVTPIPLILLRSITRWMMIFLLLVGCSNPLSLWLSKILKNVHFLAFFFIIPVLVVVK